MRIFDLTRPLEPGMPVYPGDPPVDFTPHASLAADGYRVTSVRLGTHAGTHLDAPAHFLSDGSSVEQTALHALLGPARVIEAPDDMDQVSPRERILVRSGWSARWGAEDYFTAFPGLCERFVGELAEAPAALVGLETPSLHPDHEVDARYHRILLAAGVVIVENLMNLAELPETVFLAALPLPLRGLDGSPCRVIAWENEVSP